MKEIMYIFLFTYLLTFVVSGCDTDIEPEVIQAANTYNEEYYQNLREYKKTRSCYLFRLVCRLYFRSISFAGGFISLVCRIVWTLSVCGRIPSNNPAYVETSYYNEALFADCL